MQKVTGIGGVFLKAKDVKALAAWYDEHLGFSFRENLYVNFKWVNENNPAVPGNTVFSFFKNESNYFEPSVNPFMINFRVKNLKTLLEKLNEEGVNIVWRNSRRGIWKVWMDT
jgi:lactoylglutathione lyase